MNRLNRAKQPSRKIRKMIHPKPPPQVRRIKVIIQIFEGLMQRPDIALWLPDFLAHARNTCKTRPNFDYFKQEMEPEFNVLMTAARDRNLLPLTESDLRLLYDLFSRSSK